MGDRAARLFINAMHAAVEGNKAFLRTLDSALLTYTRETTFGLWTLAELLMTSYVFHISDFHREQLAAFLEWA